MESKTCYECGWKGTTCRSKTGISKLKTEDCTCDNWIEFNFFTMILSAIIGILQFGPREPK